MSAAAAVATPAPVAAASSSAAAASASPKKAASAKPGSAAAGGSPKPVSALPASALSPQSADASAPVVVFKGATRSKKLFKLFDADKDKMLNHAEFAAGLSDFISSPDLPPLTPEQINALWIETDINKDDKVSFHEFAHRFCGGPHPSTLGKKVEKKASLVLQTLKKRENASNNRINAAMGELRDVLEAVYNGAKVRYKGVDLTKIKSLNPPALKKLINQILSEEKGEAKEAKRALEPWAAKISASGAASDQKLVDRFFLTLDTHKSGKVDLTPFFEQMKMRPSTAAGGKGRKSKKKKDASKGTGPQAYVLTTVKAEHVRDFITEQILRHMPANVNHSVKCHPALKHWGDDERRRKSLVSEGYKTTILLSERTKVKAIVKLAPPVPAEGSPAAIAAAAAAAAANAEPASSSKGRSKSPGSAAARSPSAAARSPSAAARSPSATRSKSPAATARSNAAAAASAAAAAPPVNHSDILIFAVYRTEYTSMARCESLWHARIRMDEDEVVQEVQVAETKNWTDGELDKAGLEPAFEDWTQYVGQIDEFEEMSIAPIA